MRRMVRETRLAASDFVYPLFVTHGRDVRAPIAAMPGQSRLSIDQLPDEARELRALGIPALILFGLPARKDARASEAYAADGIVQQAVRVLKDADPDLIVLTDVCLCEYTDHGHCGLLGAGGVVENDASVELIAATALSQAEAGADIVAPSDMMDGRVGAIRGALDGAGLPDVAILAYAAKFALGVLRSFSRGGGLDAGLRRSPELPDGPAQRAGGAERDRAGPCRGRGYGDGEARAAVLGSDPPSA